MSTDEGTAVSLDKKPLGQCKVCDEAADGYFFGANVCLPCKSFFVRTLSEDLSAMKCSKNTNACVIIGTMRSTCKHCRFQKCLKSGMNRKVRPEVVEAGANQDLCAVCQDIANGIHFGALTCEGCKKFFRRSLKEHSKYICRNNQDCVINPRTRNGCRYCRYQKCLRQGMSKDVKIGRPRKELLLSLTTSSDSSAAITDLSMKPKDKNLSPKMSKYVDVKTTEIKETSSDLDTLKPSQTTPNHEHMSLAVKPENGRSSSNSPSSARNGSETNDSGCSSAITARCSDTAKVFPPNPSPMTLNHYSSSGVFSSDSSHSESSTTKNYGEYSSQPHLSPLKVEGCEVTVDRKVGDSNSNLVGTSSFVDSDCDIMDLSFPDADKGKPGNRVLERESKLFSLLKSEKHSSHDSEAKKKQQNLRDHVGVKYRHLVSPLNSNPVPVGIGDKATMAQLYFQDTTTLPQRGVNNFVKSDQLAHYSSDNDLNEKERGVNMDCCDEPELKGEPVIPEDDESMKHMMKLYGNLNQIEALSTMKNILSRQEVNLDNHNLSDQKCVAEPEKTLPEHNFQEFQSKIQSMKAMIPEHMLSSNQSSGGGNDDNKMEKLKHLLISQGYHPNILSSKGDSEGKVSESLVPMKEIKTELPKPMNVDLGTMCSQNNDVDKRSELNYSGTVDKSLLLLDANKSGDVNSLKHKLDAMEKGKLCSCKKLRKEAVETMDVPMHMKTILLNRIDTGDVKANGPPFMMGGMMGMMKDNPQMMSRMKEMMKSMNPASERDHYKSNHLDTNMSGCTENATRPNKAPPDISQMFKLNSLLERFNKIKCPSCSDQPMNMMLGSTPNSENDVVSHETSPVQLRCFVHDNLDVDHHSPMSPIPKSLSNCNCMKDLNNICEASDNTAMSSKMFEQAAHHPVKLEDICIKPSSAGGLSQMSQFTTMLEGMMDMKRKMESLEQHKFIHPTADKCTETVDKLRKLLKFFGIEELEPKPNIRFESHVFESSYWLHPKLPDKNVLLDFKNKDMLEIVVSAYNHLITIMHEKVEASEDSEYQYPMDIVRKRTIRNLSHWITFVKTIPNFINILPGDQFTIVRLAGMMGIMLATALHQYDPNQHNFTNFYNFEFQPDHPHYEFRHALLDFGRDIQELNCDFVESAMMNACMAVATDYPDLEKADVIIDIRANLLEAFRAYTTAKYGTTNNRIEQIFSWIPRLRDLGLWNYKLSFSTCFSFEESS